MTLLDPDAAPVLRNWWILVELHDFADPAISASIASRFAATHHVELIASSPPWTREPPSRSSASGGRDGWSGLSFAHAPTRRRRSGRG
jgi:hypothetical protein